MIQRMDVKGVAGPIRVLLIPANEKNPNCEPRTTDKDTIEFYDLRYPHTPDGQFTGGCYYVETLFTDPDYKLKPGQGLCLYGGVPDWEVDGRTMDLIRDWVTYWGYIKS